MFQALKKNTKKIVNTIAASVLLFSQFAVVPTAHATSDNEPKVTICHRTDSYTNPYVEETVALSSVDGNAGNDNGQGDHYLEHTGPIFYTSIPKHTEWGDIIPAIPNVHNGLNWTAEGQTLLDHHCHPARGDVKVNKKVDADGNGTYEGDNSTANTLGFRWGLDDETPARTMGSTAGDVIVGTHTVTENTTSGYVFTGWYAGRGSCSEPDGTTLPVSVNVTNDHTTSITLCNQRSQGTITLVKNVVNDNGGTATANDFGLTIGGTPVTSGQTLTLATGPYAINEVNKIGYSFVSITGEGCPDQLGGNVNLANGQNITCTITNDDDAPSLTVIKHVVNDNGGTKVASDFTMNVTGTNVSDPSFPGDEAGTTVSLNVGSFSVSEGSQNGYAATYTGDCTGTIALGEHKTCTITNDDIAPLLTLLKTVVNTNGGTLGVSDFPLFVDKTQVTSGIANIFDAGAHTATETQQPGYIAGLWGGDCAADGTVTLNLGDNKTCTLTNYDQPGTLIVKKVVVNDNGGTKTAQDFSFSVNGGTAVQFEADGQNDLSVGAGTYSVTEPSVYGYAASYDNCTDVVIPNGGTATCTITNDDIDPSLTIVKYASPSTSQAFNFTSDQLGGFSLTGDDTSSSSHKFSGLNAGEYTVGEESTPGWLLAYVWCNNEQSFDPAEGIDVTLGIGDNVTCYFYNVQLNTINGHKFEDVNKDGSWDKETEPGLKGWTIQLYQECFNEESLVTQDVPSNDGGCDSTLVATTQTDENGAYSFGNLFPGPYTVCEVQQDGWVQTLPGTGDNCYNFFVEGDGQTVNDIDFGNFKNGRVEGIKFNDINGNGKRDAGEPTLQNWEITLTKECVVESENIDRVAECHDTVVGTTKTDVNGAYSFGNLETGKYKVCETMQAAWTQTFPGTKDGCTEFTIETSSQVITADFGNKPKPQVLSESTTTPAVLVNTGASAAKGTFVGLIILSVLGAVHLLGARRKNYAQ